MDYLACLSNELVYAMAVERLLDTEVPERAIWMRMMLVELQRMASHLLFQATNGMDIGALSMMIYGWREREEVLRLLEMITGLRMNHNFIRVGGLAADLPDGWEEATLDVLRHSSRTACRSTRRCCSTTRSGRSAPSASARSPPTKRSRSAPPGRSCAPPGSRGTCARRSRTSRTTTSTSTSSTPRTATATTASSSASTRSSSRCSIVRQCVERMPAGDYRVQDRKITPPPRARIDESMEALIHHFKLFTEGFKVPAGETYVAIESPRGEIGCYLVSDGTGKPARLHIRGPSFYNLQSMEAMVPGTLVADAVAIISSVDPVMGEVDR